MLVYLNGDVARGHPNYTVVVAPAADTEFMGQIEAPGEWKEANGTPKQINVVFEYGRAEVPDNLGKYMVQRGIAERSKLMKIARGLVGATERD